VVGCSIVRYNYLYIFLSYECILGLFLVKLEYNIGII